VEERTERAERRPEAAGPERLPHASLTGRLPDGRGEESGREPVARAATEPHSGGGYPGTSSRNEAARGIRAAAPVWGGEEASVAKGKRKRECRRPINTVVRGIQYIAERYPGTRQPTGRHTGGQHGRRRHPREPCTTTTIGRFLPVGCSTATGRGSIKRIPKGLFIGFVTLRLDALRSSTRTRRVSNRQVQRNRQVHPHTESMGLYKPFSCSTRRCSAP
jgi:hypothetical protein